MSEPSVGRHLLQGAVGFGLIVGALALTPFLGPVALIGMPAGLLVLRGCPMCWIAGLVRIVSRGRRETHCEDGTCTIRPAAGR
ncbi:hypothetical protein ACWEQL_19950 [Kitasatospora sp. NPDC004240]